MRWIMKKMNVISRCQALYRAEKMPCEGIKPVHHTYLLTVAREPGLSQDQIAERACVDKSGAARALNYLEEQGYVRREVSRSDKRVLQVYPTDKLTEVLPQLREIGRSWNEALTAEFTDAEMDAFLAMLSKMETRAKELSGQTEREVREA